jgi:hypothetical protein
MTFEILFVLLALLGMVIALVLDKMRPGMVLFSVVVLFLCAGGIARIGRFGVGFEEGYAGYLSGR